MRRAYVSRAPSVPPFRRGRSALRRNLHLPIAVNGFSVVVTSPTSGASFDTKRPQVTYVATTTDFGLVDVVIEWRSEQPYQNPQQPGILLPAPTYVQTMSVASGTTQSISPPEDLAYGTWWYRLRAGSTSLNLWSSWTGADRYLQVSPVIGSVVSYVEFNVGVTNTFSGNAVAYVDLNVGVKIPARLSHSSAYSDFNVGVRSAGWELDARYTDFNVSVPLRFDSGARLYADFSVTSGKPDPHIWWIRPEQGKEGYLFNIFGQGFGTSQGQYDGTVSLGGLVCSVLQWRRVSASYLTPEERKIIKGQGLDPDEINVEYGHISAVVPVNAETGEVVVELEGT